MESTSAKPIYRMSSAGKCIRALSAERLGYIPTSAPSWLETAANEGKLHEDWIVKQLEADGYMITGQQMEVTLDYPQFQLVGHIDGITLKDEKRYLLEIKTMSQFEFQRWMKEGFSGFSNYADQVSLYLQALRAGNTSKYPMDIKGIFYVIKNRSSGYIWRETIAQAPSDFELVISKLIAVEASVANDTLYEADFDPSSIECKRCRFRDQICLVSKEQLTEATEKALLEAVKKCREGKALSDQGETLYKEGKEVLENHAKAVSPDKKYTYTIDEMVVLRFQVNRVSYPKENIERAFREKVYKPLQKVSSFWTTKPTDLRKVEENGE